MTKEKKESCAPSKKYSEGSCLTLESLIKITQSYNEKFNDKIPMIYDKSFLVKELHNRLKNICNDQICWIKQDFVKNLKDDDINYNTFRFKGPKNSLKWLNTDNINKIIKQYYYLYDDFKFFGAVPIDFDDLPILGIKDLNFNDLLTKNINRLGFVFNLDEHWKSGSHWVALYADISKDQIYFFDSYGLKPEKRIRRLMKRISKFCENKSGNKPEIKYNKVRHQFKGTECGVYSTNFILRLLKGETFNDITNNITNDDKISKCRLEYFN